MKSAITLTLSRENARDIKNSKVLILKTWRQIIIIESWGTTFEWGIKVLEK